MQAEHGAHFALAVLTLHDFLVESFTKQGKGRPVNACTRLNDMRDKFLLRLLVKILKRLTAELNMPRKVVVGPVSDSFEFAHAKGKIILEVVGLL